MPLESDSFGRTMLATGVPLTTIKAECDDLVVPYQIRLSFCLTWVEDLDSRDCLRKSASINARFSLQRRGAVVSPRRACLPEVSEVGVVCMMCAFGSGGMLGPIIALSHRCPVIAGVIAASLGYDLAVMEEGTLTYSSLAHRQTRNSGRLPKDTCVFQPVGGAVCDLGRVVMFDN